jgi:predicted phosphodiesterase
MQEISNEFLEILKQALEAPTIDESTKLDQVKLAKMPKKKAKSKDKSESDWKCGVLLPDAQIGFRKYEDGSLDPFTDAKAISVAMQITAALQDEFIVDSVVNLGDTMDLPMYGKYDQENSFGNTVNETLKAGHDFFAAQRAVAPDAEIVFLEGNHDCRLEKYLKNRAPAASNMRRVGDEEFPVTSLPHLMRFDDLKIRYESGYPASKFYLNPRLIAVHGTNARSNSSTAYQYINQNPMHTTLFGHSHRLEQAYKTHSTIEGPVMNGAISPGCLCRVDGAVPSVKGGVNMDEKPITQFENWQQGMGVVWYKPNGQFRVELIHIMDGMAVYGGQVFTA